ncbi:hypothetical protein EDC01DRAFT_777283 [Geopyxis carbonaria]|nr:hypothetical protein EDC01DRAFT_777283 [Geopyxis carbonaria]
MADPNEIMLSQDEIWDDSALINSWDDALNEYKKYHSIAATGEDRDAIIKQAAEDMGEPEIVAEMEREMAAAAATVEEQVAAADVVMGENSAVEAPVPKTQTMVNQPKAVVEPPKAVEQAQPIQPEPEVQVQVEANAEQAAAAPAGPMPEFPAQVFSVGGNNEAMRNLMMAWYWAGYYTGFHDGQTKGSQPPPTT